MSTSQAQQPPEIELQQVAPPPPPQPNPVAPAAAAAADGPPGAPGTFLSLGCRSVQCVAAVLAVAAVASTGDFATDATFGFLLAASSIQSAWSFALGLLDLDVLVTKSPRLRNHWVAPLLIYGDTITAALSFCAASASSGIVLSLRKDVHAWAVNPCAKYEAATTRALISVVAILPTIVVNWWARD